MRHINGIVLLNFQRSKAKPGQSFAQILPARRDAVADLARGLGSNCSWKKMAPLLRILQRKKMRLGFLDYNREQTKTQKKL
jgi:hypothetical protein